MSPTLRQLRYFVALVDAGGFGTAAEQVHVSQPALSQQVKELEAKLGARLVERRPRSLRLTRQGEETLTRARRILAEMADLVLAVRNLEGLGGQLALGLIPTVAPYLLPTVLGRLKQQSATAEARVREAPTSLLLDGLERGQLDAVVVASPPGPGFSTLPLGRDRLLLAGSEARLNAWTARVGERRPSALSDEPLLLLEDGHCLADQALEICERPGRGRDDFGASSLSTLAGLVAQGFGLTLLPEIAVPTEARPGLGLLRFAPPEPARSLLLVVRKDSGTWAEDLADVLRRAISELVARAEAFIWQPDLPRRGARGPRHLPS